MDIIVAGGTGFIGKALVKHFLKQHHDVTVISRSVNKIKNTFNDDVLPLTWDELSSNDPSLIANADLIINLTGANIGKTFWTKKRKETILNSRVNATTLLSKLCAKLGVNAPPLFNASAVGIYGLQKTNKKKLPEALDENTFIDFSSYPDFLSEVGRKWEAATQTAKDTGARVVNMRFGVVLGKNGGVLTQLKLPFLFFIGGPIGSGRQPFSWVALKDLVRAIDFLIQHDGINGPVNIVSPECVMQKDLAKTLGKALHRPSVLTTPSVILKCVFGQMAEELLLCGQHVKPKRLTEAGFNFECASIQDTLNDILKHG